MDTLLYGALHPTKLMGITRLGGIVISVHVEEVTGIILSYQKLPQINSINMKSFLLKYFINKSQRVLNDREYQ